MGRQRPHDLIDIGLRLRLPVRELGQRDAHRVGLG
jgi:hypothetical protein